MKTIKEPYRLNHEDVIRIQKIELELLKTFISVCDKLHLTYYLHGGTLLGAKMYGGFIPWDDDIDVSMPRDDYEIFVKEGQVYLPKELFIQTCYNDKEYTLCFAKLRDTSTLLIEHSLQNRKKMVNGVYIDIFPIDGVKNKKRSMYARLLRRRIDMSYWDVEYCPFYKKVIVCLLVFPFLFISANKATQLLDLYRRKKRLKDNEANYFLINRWYYPTHYYQPKPNNSLMFCGIQMNTVRDVDNWLLIDYPNYKVIPPKNEQIPGHKLVEHRF